MKKIYITEQQLKHILNESAKDKAALNYLETKGVTDYNKKMEIIGALKHDIPNLRLDNGKFMLGALRLYFDRQLSNEQNIRTFYRVLKYIHSGNHSNEFDFDLNGLSLQELDNKFKDNIKQDNDNDRVRSELTQRGNGNGYTIIPINNYEEAKPYGKYTSWCVTHGSDAFESYTQGGNRFYFCLKNGFENVEKNDEGAPINEYGLSMIAVNVDVYGNLTRITTRYNHDFDGENNSKLDSVEQLENILDVNFYQVFKPYTREELHSMGVILFDEVQGLLDSGKDPKEIFDDVDEFNDGFARVELNDKSNFINTEYKLLSDTWFDSTDYFYEGFAVVELNDKCNFINTEGKLLSDTWFDDAYKFSNGFAMVLLNNNLYKLRKDGVLCDYDTKEPLNLHLTNNEQLNENNMLMEKQEETTYYRFLSEVKSFLSKLLQDPINAQPSKYLKDRNFDKAKLIRVLLKRDILERNEKILTPDKNGEKETKYYVTYKVKRKDFERKIRKIHIQYFEKNVPEKEELNEEGEGGAMGGATSTGSVGGETSLGYVGYSAPMSDVLRRTMLPNRKKDKNYVDPTKILGKEIKAESKQINESKIIAYHGSSMKQEELIDDRWTYFTDNPEYAKGFGNQEVGGTYKAELTLNKPLYIDSLDCDIFDEESNEDGEQWSDFEYSDAFMSICKQLNVSPKVFEDYDMFYDIEYNCLWEIVNDSFFVNLVEKKGFDSIITEESGVKVYITFHPNQIKWINNINKKIYITEKQLNYDKSKLT